MGKYGKAAVEATKRVRRNRRKERPRDAWRAACEKVLCTKHTREKGCPRDAFLGLCEAGEINGVEPGNYVRPRLNKKLNKEYALKAVRLLRSDPSLASPKTKLWKLVQKGRKNKVGENGQLDVVLALWEKKLINGNEPADNQ